jgi:hypothetical protein
LLVWQRIDGEERAKDASRTPISASCLARNFKAMRRHEILTNKQKIHYKQQFQLLAWQGI